MSFVFYSFAIHYTESFRPRITFKSLFLVSGILRRMWRHEIYCRWYLFFASDITRDVFKGRCFFRVYFNLVSFIFYLPTCAYWTVTLPSVFYVDWKLSGNVGILVFLFFKMFLPVKEKRWLTHASFFFHPPPLYRCT